MVTSERLKAIKEWCERATPGPWIVSPNRHKAKDGSQWGIIEARIRTVTGGIVAHTICTWDGDNGRANAEFIRAAREEVPALVEEVERWWALKDELRKLIETLREDIDDCLETAKEEAEYGDGWQEARWRGWAEGLTDAAKRLERLLNKLEAEVGADDTRS